ncbi:hypothetical protein PIB30_049510 [Stylosanthes scabra]|uniref:Ubiquitin-like protease family profile domain-containing protein n=1 Tax=Stylosanthes scabra TaxID=79078 RepID=A0ABU6TH37_9FABA|nr:hypothetical protein [Stylosanthes scabra]
MHAETVRRIKKRKQQEKEDRSNKKTKHCTEDDHQCQVQEDALIGLEPEPPQQEDQSPQQPHLEEVIDIFSSYEDEHQPTPSQVFFSLIPKAEEKQPQEEEQPPKQPTQQEEQPPQPRQEEENPPIDEEQLLEVEEQPTQTHFPIHPTQEVIDISSSSDDEHQPTSIQVLIPKAEEDPVSSPRAKIITDVLLSMNQEPPPESEPDDAPSFDLGIDYGTGPHQTQEEPLVTTQPISEIEELDVLIKQEGDQFQTPQPTQSLNIRNELHDRVAIWATVPIEGNEFEKIFKLSGHRFLEAMRYKLMSMRPRSIMCHTLNMEENEWFEKQVYCVPPDILTRMLETHGHNWMDKKKKKPHDISTLKTHEEYMCYLDRDKLLTHRFLFAPILFSQHWWLYVLDVTQKDFFILYYKNIVPQPMKERH